MMLTTGISMLGKMSVGVRTMAIAPKRKMRIPSTTMVYGSFRASLTIHMIHIPYSVRRGRTASAYEPTLLPVLGGLGIQSRDHLLCRRRNSDSSGQNDVPGRNLPAVDTAVVAIVRTDCGALERDSREQAARS